MSEVIVVRRRKRRSTPMRSRRLAAIAGAAPAPGEFPGAVLPEPESARGRLLSGGLSLFVHVAVIAALALAAWLTPQQTVEEIIKITRLPNQIEREQSAPRPKVVAESLGRFDPAPMAVAPQVPNPAVIQHRAAVVPVQKIDVDAVSPVQAPREVKPVASATQVDTVRAYQSVAAATTSPVPVDVPAPALAGPKELRAETGVQSGPKQILPTGNTAGTGGPHASGTGSSVREGIASNRDVLGAPKGVRADVNWAVGGKGGRGLGGNGTGPGGITWQQCATRPEVESYMAQIQTRVLSRWILPTDINGNQAVTLRFVLDPSGTASRIEYASGSTTLAKSAVEAMRSASPFDQMTDRVRCLAGTPIQATFRNPTVAAN